MATAADKRRSPRVRRRLQVVFDHDRSLRAQTTNLSRTGLCVSSDFVAAPGSEIGGALMLPDGEANFEATVIWARKVRGGKSLDEKNTMGLEFTIPPGMEYDHLVEQAVSARATGLHQAAGQQPQARARGPAGSATAPATARQQPQPAIHPALDRRAEPALRWPSSPLGLIGRARATVKAQDLAALPSRYSSGLGIGAVAGWVELAAIRCVAGILPLKAVTVGVSSQITVSHRPAAREGDEVTTTVRVSGVSADSQIVTFEFRVDDGQRALAAGHHTRQLLEQRKV